MANEDKTKKPNVDQVGYRKPPAHSQFKKGQSGNPKGRPKGTRNLGSVLAKSLREQVVINENGTRKTITKLEAATKQLTNKAAAGDLNALRHLITVVLTLEGQPPGASVQEVAVLDEADQKVVMGILKRLENSLKRSEGK